MSIDKIGGTSSSADLNIQATPVRKPDAPKEADNDNDNDKQPQVQDKKSDSTVDIQA